LTVDGEQTKTTSVIKRTLNPYWNESFDVYASQYSQILINRTVKESSIIAVQIFDQRKFKKKDQGFLGVINCRVGDVLDLQLGGEGIKPNDRV
jgi:E3 ubiquitin-protein ligase NEDD4